MIADFPLTHSLQPRQSHEGNGVEYVEINVGTGLPVLPDHLCFGLSYACYTEMRNWNDGNMVTGGSCLIAPGSMSGICLRSVVAIIVQRMPKVEPQVSGTRGKIPLSGDYAPVLKPSTIQQSFKANCPEF